LCNALVFTVTESVAELFLEQCHAVYHVRNRLSADNGFRCAPFLLHCVRREDGREHDNEERDPIAYGDSKHP
jgi:hypothetical protein